MNQTFSYKNKELLSYAEYGDKNGFPILVQHGMIASIRDYDLFERLMQLNARLICMARPGYGESSPYEMENIAEWGEIVSALVEELGLSSFDVLGLSSGAPYGYAIAYRLPDKVRNLYIFSGTPALYDEKVQAHWPFLLTKNASLAEMQKVAREVFFPNVSAEDRKRNDIHDSMQNDCFGIAQDLKLRCMDWGFRLSDVKGKVIMRHSKSDDAVPFVTAALTAELLSNCHLIAEENGVHFSKEALDEFIQNVIEEYY